MKTPFPLGRRMPRSKLLNATPALRSTAPGMPPARQPWLLLVVLLIVGGFLCPVVRNGICWVDDPANVASSRMTPPWFDGDHLPWYWRHSVEGLYVPLSYMAWGLLAALTYVQTPDEQGLGIDPHVFHAASLGWHLLNVALVFTLLRRMLRCRKRWHPRRGRRLRRRSSMDCTRCKLRPSPGSAA